MTVDLYRRCVKCNRMLYTSEPIPFEHDTCRYCMGMATGGHPALDKAREILAIQDAGTHFNAREVLIVLRALVEEITQQQKNVLD